MASLLGRSEHPNLVRSRLTLRSESPQVGRYERSDRTLRSGLLALLLGARTLRSGLLGSLLGVFLLLLGDWRPCYVGLEGPVVPPEKVLGSAGI